MTSKLKIGTLLGNEVFRVENVELLPYVRNEGDNISNELTKRMIKSVLTTEYFYFSYTYDLTHSMQHLNYNSELSNKNLYGRADPKFTWNRFLVQTLDKRMEFSHYMLPIVHGGN